MTAQRSERIAARFPCRLQPVPGQQEVMMPPNLREPNLETLALAAAKLSAVELEVLLLSAGQGLSHAAIAEQLGLSVKAVERHLCRALVKLDRKLERRKKSWWTFW